MTQSKGRRFMPIMNYLDLPIGKDYPNVVDCVVEISKDTNAKYEYDEDLHIFRLDRCLLSSMNYPCSYGFIPSTHCDDGDALDMVIYNTTPILTGTVVTCRVIGVLDMTDSGQKDYKVVGVPIYNPNAYQDISEIDPMFLKVTRNFFQYYKELEHKKVDIGDWMDAAAARAIVEQSHMDYIHRRDAGE